MPRNRNDEHTKALGQRIRARRQWLDMTLETLAAAIGVSHQQVQKYERGGDDLTSARVVQVAAALDITPNALLGLDGDTLAPHADGFAPLLADPSVASIVRRLRDMTDAQRKMAHALVCAAQVQA